MAFNYPLIFPYILTIKLNFKEFNSHNFRNSNFENANKFSANKCV